jgi:hypothetical protein
MDIEITVMTVFKAVFFVLFLIPLYLLGLELFFRTQTPLTKKNNNEEAKNLFLTLLKKSKKNLKVYDDGEEFFYTDPDIIQALENKLTSNPQYTISFHFNLEPTEELKEFSETYKNRFSLSQGPWGDEKKQRQHFKLFDDGKIAIESYHDKDSTTREYRVYEKQRWQFKNPIVKNMELDFKQQKNA